MTLLGCFQTRSSSSQKRAPFDLDVELARHGWRPAMSAAAAEQVLSGQSSYTYLLRRSEFGRGFSISYVRMDGIVVHDSFTLLDPKFGIFRNGGPQHVGRLEKVIRDMMHCPLHVGQPIL